MCGHSVCATIVHIRRLWFLRATERACCLSTTAEVKFTVLIFHVRRRRSASWRKAQPCLLESYFIECLMSQDKDKKLMGLNTGKAGSTRSFMPSSIYIAGTFQSCIERGPIPAGHTHVRRHHLEVGCCYDSCVWQGLGSLNDALFSWSELVVQLVWVSKGSGSRTELHKLRSFDGCVISCGLTGCRHPPTDVIYFT